MQMHNVNWRDFESVLAYAKHIAMRAASLIIYMYWDAEGKGRYHLTYRRENCGTNTIVAIIGGLACEAGVAAGEAGKGDNDNVKE